MINKFYIDSFCLTKKGGLNNRVCLESWWENKGLMNIYSTIFTQTNFLPENSSISERLYCISNDIRNETKCQHCLNEKVNFKNYSEGYHRYCSVYCSTQSTERNMKIHKNRDYATMLDSIKKTNLERYGVEYSTQTDEMKKKSKDTKLNRYGNTHYNNIEKMKKTNLERYGVEYSCMSEVSKSKSLDTIKKKHPILFDKDLLMKENITKSIQQISEELDVSYRTVWLAFDRLDIEPNFFRSSYNGIERDIQTFISETLGYENEKIHMNDRNVIGPKELDIFIPSKKVGIELNGTYWHSYDSAPRKEEKERHLTKTKLCKNVGVRLIQFWDDEWLSQRSICEDIIRRALRLTENVIYARDTRVVKLSPKESNTFLDKNHIQGGKGASHRYGLITNDGEIVSVMTFGKSRFNKNHQYEIIRYATKMNHHIIGGAEKIFKSFITEIEPISIISYCDRRLFDGKLYHTLGFTPSELSDNLDYYWVKHNKRISRIRTRKQNLNALLGSNYDPNLTEDENMFTNGYRKLYGCGNDAWLYKKRDVNPSFRLTTMIVT
jgi:very-short-patch-repair endonuclease